MFQRQRVDMLLGELLRKFPLPMIPSQQQQQVVQQNQPTPNQNGLAGDSDPRLDSIKQEPPDTHQNNGMKHGNDNDMDVEKSDMKPPPEKKLKC